MPPSFVTADRHAFRGERETMRAGAVDIRSAWIPASTRGHCPVKTRRRLRPTHSGERRPPSRPRMWRSSPAPGRRPAPTTIQSPECGARQRLPFPTHDEERLTVRGPNRVAYDFKRRARTPAPAAERQHERFRGAIRAATKEACVVRHVGAVRCEFRSARVRGEQTLFAAERRHEIGAAAISFRPEHNRAAVG